MDSSAAGRAKYNTDSLSIIQILSSFIYQPHRAIRIKQQVFLAKVYPLRPGKTSYRSQYCRYPVHAFT